MKNRIRAAIRAHHRDQALRELGRKALLAVPMSLAFGGFGTAAVAQEPVMRLEEVIVSARRKDEFLQDVPLTVNVLDKGAIQDLNIRRLEDIQTVVAGLTLSEDPIAPNASVRGVRFDAFASGNNPTVEFYLNDSPIVSAVAVQGLFDIAQIEVLRGPQGTLRGRASPSGAINLTSQQPDLEEFGGYVDYTTTNIDAQNIRGALNIPIVRDMLAFRVAGFREDNNGDRIRSYFNDKMSAYDGEGYRTSLRFNPMDSLTFNLMYQRLTPKRRTYTQVESAMREDPTASPSVISIRPGDRRAVMAQPSYSDQVLERTGFDVAWDINDFMTLNYAGALTELETSRDQQDDTGGFFTINFPNVASLQDFGQQLKSYGQNESHELRLTTELDNMDFVVGGLWQQFDTDNRLTQFTPLRLAFAGNIWRFNETPVRSGGLSTEKSVFGNVTYHFTDDTEASLGLRYINFSTESQTIVNGAVKSDVDEDYNKVVYMASVKHSFTPDLMAYATLGSSWRPGINVVGNFSSVISERERSFTELEPETSKSLELGTKASMLDGQLRVSAATYYQEFDNYPYRTGGNGVYHISTDTNGESVASFNFTAPVPVNVYGLELEATYQATPNWSMGALYSWSKGELDNGTVPCNDYGGAIPTVADIRAATGGEQIAVCQANYRSNFAPLWTATLQSEYSYPMQFIGAEAYVRGLVTFYGDSQNDPANSIDDVDSYNIVNLYAGLRSDNETWELMVYAKNIFETERVLERGANEEDITYRRVVSPSPTVPPIPVTGITGYRSISMTDPRELGINVKYNF